MAGGTGSRVGSLVPKQYRLVGGVPIIVRTAEALLNSDDIDQIIIVCAPGYREFLDYWFRGKLRKEIILYADGGATGQLSIFNGLKKAVNSEKAGEDSVAVVQDAVRPFISPQVVSESVVLALAHGGAVCSSPATETVVQLEGAVERVLNRDEIRFARAPQAFNLFKLYEAHLAEISIGFRDNTDSLALMSKYGLRPVFFEGPPHNIKITTEMDILFAEGFFKSGT